MRKFMTILVATFILSAINAADWKAPGIKLLPESHPQPISEAKWIWYKVGDKMQTKCFLRLKVMIDEPVKSAKFHAFCDPKGTFFLNGQKLRMTSYAPEDKLRGDRKAREADIAPLLKKGENIIAVVAEKNEDKIWLGISGRGGIILRGNIELDSGKNISLASTSAFKGNSKISGNSWMLPGFDDSAWTPACEQGDVRLWPWSDFNNMAAIFGTPTEYNKHVNFLKEQPLPSGLAEEPDARPKIVYRGIIPGIEINGKVLPPYVSDDEAYSFPERDDIVRKMYLAGCRIFAVIVQPNRFRLPSGEFDFSELGYSIRRILALAPDSYIQIYYSGWERYMYFLKKNPDEATGYATPSTLKGTYADTTFAPSFASVKFRGEVRRVLGELGKFCQTKPWYKRLIGVHSGFGHSGDGMPWGCHCMPDTGKRMTEAFRVFLKKKYMTDGALRKAWGDNKVSLDTALVPDAKKRWGQGHYLHDPVNPVDRRVTDYYACYHDQYSDYVIEFGKSVKKAFPHRLAGAYYGYVILGYTPEGYTANFERVLASPYIDYMRATTKGYNMTDGLFRHLTATFRRYGKLSSIEADIRTHAAMLNQVIVKSVTCKTPEETVATVRKVIGNSFLYGAGVHYVDFGRPSRWFNCPEALTVIHRGIDIWRKLFKENLEFASDIATIIDPIELTRQGYPDFHKTYPLTDAMTTNALQSLSFSGLSYDFLSLKDYLAGTHDYKAAVFLNSYSVNGNLRKALLAKLRRPGHLAVWDYAPGIISEKGFSDESMSELTGIGLKAKYSKLPFAFKLADGGRIIGPKENNKFLPISPRVYCDDPNVKVLGRYVDDQTPALVSKHLADGSTAVFAGVPVSTPQLWAELLSPVCHAYSLPGVFVRVNSKLLQVHVSKGGMYPISLPHRVAKVTDLFTGKTIATQTDRFLLKTETPFTWLLKIKNR